MFLWGFFMLRNRIASDKPVEASPGFDVVLLICTDIIDHLIYLIDESG